MLLCFGAQSSFVGGEGGISRSEGTSNDLESTTLKCPPWHQACIIGLATIVDIVSIVGVVGMLDVVGLVDMEYKYSRHTQQGSRSVE